MMRRWKQFRSRTPVEGEPRGNLLGIGGIVVLVAVSIAFVRAFLVIRGSPVLRMDPTLLWSLQWILALFASVIVCLTLALLRWWSDVRATQVSSVRMQRMFGVINQLQDPLFAVDHSGRILGSNLKARQLSAEPIRNGAPVASVFPPLQEVDLPALLDQDVPREVTVRDPGQQDEAVYRIRSYPAEDMVLLLISDITSQAEEAEHREQQGQQQLIGRIAQGVAHDFNNILCAISGHAALMSRSERLTESESDSLTTIADEANRGAILARQLVDLSRPVDTGSPTADLGTILQRSASMLKKAISHPDWQVVADVASAELFPQMPQAQLEQLFIRFGLQLTDEYEDPQTLHLLLRRPGAVQLGDVEPACDVVVFVLVSPPDHPADLRAYQIDETPPLSEDGGGVIQSVVLALLERYGGSFDVLINQSGFHGYRICLTRKLERSELDEGGGEDEDLNTLIGWNVLLARPATLRWNIAHMLLKDMGAEIRQVNNVVAALHELEHGPRLHAVLIDESLLGMDPSGTLRKAIRCQPDAAFVLLRLGRSHSPPLPDQVAPLERPVTLLKLQRTLLRARRLAHQRGQPALFPG